jgi:hypothetical protein
MNIHTFPSNCVILFTVMALPNDHFKHKTISKQACSAEHKKTHFSPKESTARGIYFLNYLFLQLTNLQRYQKHVSYEVTL